MEKGLCYGALGIAALMLLIFLLDLFGLRIFGVGKDAAGKDINPFTVVDVFGVLASGIVGYVAWNASRDLK
ncbi:MAG TPA: hypothetical protein VGL71_06790 [Urbifossiella sp.]|jgi:hypothetical protein